MTVVRHEIPQALIGSRRVYHKPHGKPYAFGCTEEAIARAGRRHFDGIDLDHRRNKQGRGQLSHQPNPTRRDGWRDSRGLIGDARPMLSLTNAECDRLHYQGHKMLSLREGLLLCKRAGLVPCIEDKTFTGEPVSYWLEVKAMADELGVVPVIMSLPGANSVPGARKLKAAHDAGLVTMWLWRPGCEIPDFVDLVKSHRHRAIYRHSSAPVAPRPTARPVKPRIRPWSRRGRRIRRRNRPRWNRLRAAWRRWRARR
jgi:hypothetical protein